jgi:hypothetical protein
VFSRVGNPLPRTKSPGLAQSLAKVDYEWQRQQSAGAI